MAFVPDTFPVPDTNGTTAGFSSYYYGEGR